MALRHKAVEAAMIGFAIIGVGFLGASVVELDPLFFLMALGAFAWVGLLGLMMQPWHEG